jgi:hypothetical protein
MDMTNYGVQTNEDLRRFFLRANKCYFGGKLKLYRIEFSSKLENRFHGKCQVVVVDLIEINVKTLKKRPVEMEMYRISISPRLKRARDLCMMTVYHEMVHAELDMLGFRGKDLDCRKSSALFNNRMTELAQAGAFNGLW